MGKLASEVYEDFKKRFPKISKDAYEWTICRNGIAIHFRDGLTARYDWMTYQLCFIPSQNNK